MTKWDNPATPTTVTPDLIRGPRLRKRGSRQLATGLGEGWIPAQGRDDGSGSGALPPYLPKTSSTHSGTSTLAAPNRLSANQSLPADRSRFSSSVSAP